VPGKECGGADGDFTADFRTKLSEFC